MATPTPAARASADAEFVGWSADEMKMLASATKAAAGAFVTCALLDNGKGELVYVDEDGSVVSFCTGRVLRASSVLAGSRSVNLATATSVTTKDARIRDVFRAPSKMKKAELAEGLFAAGLRADSFGAGFAPHRGNSSAGPDLGCLQAEYVFRNVCEGSVRNLVALITAPSSTDRTEHERVPVASPLRAGSNTTRSAQDEETQFDRDMERALRASMAEEVLEGGRRQHALPPPLPAASVSASVSRVATSVLRTMGSTLRAGVAGLVHRPRVVPEESNDDGAGVVVCGAEDDADDVPRAGDNDIVGYATRSTKQSLANVHAVPIDMLFMLHKGTCGTTHELHAVSRRETRGVSAARIRYCRRCGAQPASELGEEVKADTDDDVSSEGADDVDAVVGYVSASALKALGKSTLHRCVVHGSHVCHGTLLVALTRSVQQEAQNAGIGFTACKRCGGGGGGGDGVPAAAAVPVVAVAGAASAAVPVVDAPLQLLTLRVNADMLVRAPECVMDVYENREPLAVTSDMLHEVWVTPSQVTLAAAAARRLLRLQYQQRQGTAVDADDLQEARVSSVVHVHASGRLTSRCSLELANESAARERLTRRAFTALRDDDRVHMVKCPVCYSDNVVVAAEALHALQRACEAGINAVLTRSPGQMAVRQRTQLKLRADGVPERTRSSSQRRGRDSELPFELTGIELSAHVIELIDRVPAHVLTAPMRPVPRGTSVKDVQTAVEAVAKTPIQRLINLLVERVRAL